jgi:type IV pilus assembly protein PilM
MGLSINKFKNKLPKEKSSIGIDVGVSAIKIVRLRALKDKLELYSFSLDPFQNGLAGALKTISKSQEVKKANISVCGPNTIIRYAPFPKMSVDELKNALKFEAQKHIPFSISEVNLDAYILKPELPDNKMLVLLAAAKRDFVNQRLKAFEEAGITVNTVDIDSIALINAFNFNYSEDEKLKNKTIALLNIGETITNLNILQEGISGLSRDINIGSDNVTQAIKDALKTDIKTAEELRLNSDKEKQAKIAVLMESVFSNLAQEVRASFDYYESHGLSGVQKIFLSGGGSMSFGAKDMLANLLGIEAEYWNPFKRINIANNINAEALNKVSVRLAIALGLALRF